MNKNKKIELSEKDLDIAMRAMECWECRNHLKKCKECRKSLERLNSNEK